jgi:hypothetical protein
MYKWVPHFERIIGVKKKWARVANAYSWYVTALLEFSRALVEQALKEADETI